MPVNHYRFLTRWRVQAAVQEVSDIIEDAESLVQWWPSVYLDVRVLKQGLDGGIGKIVSLYTKGWLPYTLRWQLEVTESRTPFGFSLQAWGDLTGHGKWVFEQDKECVNIIYDWRIYANKLFLRYFGFVFKSIFSANHRWAMAKGEQSLKLELERRRQHIESVRPAIPAPPAATFARFVRGGSAWNSIRGRNSQLK